MVLSGLYGKNQILMYHILHIYSFKKHLSGTHLIKDKYSGTSKGS